MASWSTSRHARSACAVALLAACLPWALAQEAPARRLPIESFAMLPKLSDVVLSPDGRRFAAVFNEPDHTLLITRAVEGAKAQAVLQTDNTEYQINWVRWVNDERLLVSVRFAWRRGSTQTVETRLLSVKSDGSGARNLVTNRPDFGSVTRMVRTQQLQDQVIDWLPGDGQHVLLQLSDGDRALPAVYKVDVESGEKSMLQAPERDVYRWISDAQHRVRIAVYEKDGSYEIRAREPEGKAWRTLWAFSDLGDAVWPLGFGLDPQELFVSADHDGRAAVFSVRLDQAGLPRTLKLANPRFDVGGALMHSPASGEVIGLRSSATEDGSGQTRSELWNPDWRALAQAIDLGLPRRNNRLLDISRDEQHYLVYSSGNGQPGEYFIGDRRSGTMDLIGQTYPLLKAADLSGKKPAEIKARDGLRLPAYVTLPQHRAAGDAPWPLILFPRCRPGRHRQCVGASYGGYAALMGLIKTPDLYRCAVSFAGVSDLPNLIQYQSSYIGGTASVERMIGNAWRDRERLRATSPARLAERVQSPVLLVHGTDDRVVPVEQSEDMAKALRRAGKTYRFIEQDGGDHQLSQNPHRLEFFRALESFLDEQLQTAKK